MGSKSLREIIAWLCVCPTEQTEDEGTGVSLLQAQQEQRNKKLNRQVGNVLKFSPIYLSKMTIS